MRILSIQPEPVIEIPYLNAGRGPGAFYEDRLPILVGSVDRLPDGVDEILATGDLQGRERFEESDGGPIRLLGEVLPARLEDEILPNLGLPSSQKTGVFLAGDFYTVPSLDKRGGSGDVTTVWQAFGNCFAWVAGVAGNHDTFGSKPETSPRFSGDLHYLDGDRKNIAGLKVADIGGIIGNPKRPRRRSEDDYLRLIESLLQHRTDVLLMHDGPNSLIHSLSGSSRMREVIEQLRPKLVVRGHAHWNIPLVELAGGVQVLNVDARVVVLRERGA